MITGNNYFFDEGKSQDNIPKLLVTRVESIAAELRSGMMTMPD